MKQLLFVLGLVACGKTEPALPPKPHAFPGFTIELPAGKEQSGGDDYARGALELTSASKPQYVISIKWQMAAMSADILEQWQDGVGAQLGARATFARVQHAGRASVEAVIDDMFMVMTSVPCGKRLITVQLTAYEPALRGLYDRVVGSVACKPDPKAETADALPIAIELRGFTRRADGVLVDGDATLSIAAGPAMADFDATRAGQAWLASAGLPAGASLVVVKPGLMSAELDGRSVAIVRFVECPTGITQIAGAASTAEGIRRVTDVADAARCLEPGQPPTPLPATAD